VRLTSKFLAPLATAALLTGATAPAFADDDPPPIPAYCLDDEGNLLNLEGCPGYRQASGH
jgi:hypothetical protein